MRKIRKGQNFLKLHEKQHLQFDGELKQINFLKSRVYQREENKFYPSVTSILNYVPKSKFYLDWLKDVGYNADIIREKAAKEGTQTHNAIEDLLLGKEVSWINEYGEANYNELVWEMILKFSEFWQTYKPTLVQTEKLLFSDEHEYAGTADIVLEIKDERWLVDIKTSNTLSKSYDLQLAAYVIAWNERFPDKPIDRTGILWLKSAKRGPDRKGKVIQGKGWELKEVEDIDKNFKLFKNIYEFFKLDNPVVEPIYQKYPLTVKL